MKHPYKHNMALLDWVDSPKNLRKLKLKQLPDLAQELRTDMIASVAKTGGHLGASLGVVELTIALHYVFNTPKDLLVWDIGHQTYPHKILTGRRERMDSLRQEKGLSGFAMISESPYDHFGAGHSSTAISAALGMAIANQKKGLRDKVIAVIGDGAMSAGLAFEAMNNVGHLKVPMVVILNDNDMSIAPPVGGLSDHLTMLMSSKPFLGLRQLTFDSFDFLPKSIKKKLKLTESYVRGLASGGNFFEHLGFYYVGVVDGHNLDHLVAVFKNIKKTKLNVPILLHVVTQKGKGYLPAEMAEDKFHGVTQFDVSSGKSLSGGGKLTYTNVVSHSLTNIMAMDKNIIAITAAMPSGTGLDKVAQKFPQRVYDVGIAEQHATTFAAGLATRGMKPFVAIYATFMQRAMDQVIHDVAVQNLPVRFLLDRGGYVGADGATHHGAFDLAMFCALPNMVMMAPKDEAELDAMIYFMKDYNDGPIAVRYPRGGGTGAVIPKKPLAIKLGKAEVIQKAKNHSDKKIVPKIALWGLGTMVMHGKSALEILSKRKPTLLDHITFINARFAKPIDKELVINLRQTHDVFITMEEGVGGGFHQQMAGLLEKLFLKDKRNIVLHGLYMADNFIEQASVDRQLEMGGISPAQIAKTIEQLI